MTQVCGTLPTHGAGRSQLRVWLLNRVQFSAGTELRVVVHVGVRENCRAVAMPTFLHVIPRDRYRVVPTNTQRAPLPSGDSGHKQLRARKSSATPCVNDVAVCGRVWQCVAVCGSVWQGVAGCGVLGHLLCGVAENVSDQPHRWGLAE